MRKCTEQDYEKLMAYLNREPEINLFFIGDIHNFGFSSEIMCIYMDEDQDGIHAVYLVYIDNLCIQSYEGKADQRFVEELIKKYQITCISGETSLIDKYSLDQFDKEFPCKFASIRKLNTWVDTSEVLRLGIEDVERIADLQTLGFPDTPRDEEAIRVTIESDSGRYYGIFQDGKLVSMAGSSAECYSLGMVVGVCTDPKYRGKQYASKCVTKLSSDLLKEGKIPCLFYYNPSAARIYKALGYEDVGGWKMLRRSGNELY